MCQKDIRKEMETEKKLITILPTQGENQDNIQTVFEIQFPFQTNVRLP